MNQKPAFGMALHRTARSEVNIGGERTVSAHLVEAMAKIGIRAAFGVPGGAIGTVFDQLCQSDIDVILTQHEGAAAYASMGRAMAALGRELPLCFATSGPGMTNLITGVAAAYAESMPMFVLTGNSLTQKRGMGALQDSYAGGIDAVRMFDSVTVANQTVFDENDVIPLFYRFAEASLRHRKPVHLNLPLDVSNAKLVQPLGEFSRPSRGALHLEDRKLLDRFLRAARPVIFAGNGVKLSGLGSLLAQAANRHRIGVIVSTHGRSGIPEDEPCFQGCFGFASDGTARQFLEYYAPDAILFLGTGLGEMATSGWSPLLARPALRIHVDIDPSKFNRAFTMTGVIENDVQAALLELLEHPSREGSLPTVPVKSMVVPRSAPADPLARVHPQSLFDGLSRRLPENAVVFAEMGNSMAWAFRHFAPYDHRQLFVPLGLASMGSALGASIGAATYWRNRTIVCVSGDAATLMHGAELKTAVEYELPVKFVILNDGGLGMVHHGSRLIGLHHTNVRYRNWVDFEQFGTALGLTGRGRAVRNEAEWRSSAIEDALEHPGPALLDVWIDPSAVPPIAERARVLERAESA